MVQGPRVSSLPRNNFECTGIPGQNHLPGTHVCHVQAFSVYLVTINNYSTNKAKLKFEFEVAYISKLMQGPLIITISVRGGGGQEADPPNFSEIENSGRKRQKFGHRIGGNTAKMR